CCAPSKSEPAWPFRASLSVTWTMDASRSGLLTGSTRDFRSVTRWPRPP
ncbi:MAG: hypothetical protein AVDCRST_MAG15-94, partial [uncultured Rubellimicrobium sp.]